MVMDQSWSFSRKVSLSFLRFYFRFLAVLIQAADKRSQSYWKSRHERFVARMLHPKTIAARNERRSIIMV
jgi:hypothetical protein